MPRSKNNSGRNKGKNSPKPQPARRILILCEDEKSSRDYLASFPIDPELVVVECIGMGMNTDSLMEKAIKRKQEGNYEELWVVFDKDDFSDHQFNRAFDLARKHSDITVCWSNECFELWYLLHFRFQNTGIGREDIYRKLAEELRSDYDKADPSMYETLLDKQETALKHAEKLAFTNVKNGEPHANPSTHLHELVKLLNSFDPDR